MATTSQNDVRVKRLARHYGYNAKSLAFEARRRAFGSFADLHGDERWLYDRAESYCYHRQARIDRAICLGAAVLSFVIVAAIVFGVVR